MPTHGSMTDSLDIARIEALLDDRFPQIHSGGRIFTVEEIGERSARVRMRLHERMLRPGGTVSGSAMFSLADFSVYVAIIATLGEAGIDAVTTNLNINFPAHSKSHHTSPSGPESLVPFNELLYIRLPASPPLADHP